MTAPPSEALSIQSITAEQTYALRHSVLWPDKPFDFVKVENDADGRHCGAFQNGELVSVISLFVTGKEARFRKFATHPGYQRQGIGTLMLTHVIAQARRFGATTIWCDARLDAADFYRRFDMKPVSDVFYKGPIAYAKFSRSLL